MQKIVIQICRKHTKVTLLYKNNILAYSCHHKAARATPIIGSKQLGGVLDNIKYDGRSKGHKPSINHPWRRYEPKAKRTELVREINNSL